VACSWWKRSLIYCKLTIHRIGWHASSFQLTTKKYPTTVICMSNQFVAFRASLSKALSTRTGKLIGIVVLLASLGLVAVQVQHVQNLRQEAAAPLTAPIGDSPVNRKILLLIFNPIIENNGNKRLTVLQAWQNPDLLTSQLLPALHDASHGFLSYEVVERQEIDGWPTKEAGFVYNDASYLQCLQDTGTCHNPDIIDYEKLFADFAICSKNVDEVWLWGGPYFGYFEYNPVNYCGNTQFVMGFNYERELDEALHDFGHRMEFVAIERINKGTGVAWEQNALTEWNKFSMITGHCGNVHNPPGAPEGYNYSKTSPVQTDCNGYLNYPSGPYTVQAITCAAWNCTQRGFMEWWLSHIPSKSGTSIDQGTGRTLYDNWWKYYAYFDETVTGIPGGSEPRVGEFSGFSSLLRRDDASFEFSYSGNSNGYIIDLSTFLDMSSDVYLDFARGSQSPVFVVSTQELWDKYRCGSSLYWRVHNADRSVSSSIQEAIVDCALINTPTPTLSPTPTYTPTPTPTKKPTPTRTPTPDRTGPRVQFIFPLNGITVAKGKATLMNVFAADPAGVTNVTFFVNNVKLCTDTTASRSLYSCSWKVPNTTGVTYALKAIATDKKGNSSSSTVTVISK